MMAIRFPAILKDEDGVQIEVGTGELASEDNTIIFRGGFIPLTRIGTTMEISRTAYGSDVDSFRGQVFRSTKNLISLETAESDSMLKLKATFFSNTYFSAWPSHFKMSRLFKHKRIKTYDVEATVYYISEDKLKFLSIDPIKPGEQLLLNLKEPIEISGALLDVIEVVDFDGVSNACICSITTPHQDPS